MTAPTSAALASAQPEPTGGAGGVPVHKQLERASFSGSSGAARSLVGEDGAPSPADFVTFLPWACRQLGVEQHVVVLRLALNEYVSADRVKAKPKPKPRVRADEPSERRMPSVEERLPAQQQLEREPAAEADAVRVHAVFDAAERLVHVSFVGARRVPRIVLKLLALVAPFHPALGALSMRGGGLDAGALHEMAALPPLGALTDLCLDGCPLPAPAPNLYGALLTRPGALRQLSLARCRLGDAGVCALAVALPHPQPAAATLMVLNLASNGVTDEGAEGLAAALRSNRRLCYLNLADNALTDTGVRAILSTLDEFPLTADELLAARARRLAMLRSRAAAAAARVCDDQPDADRRTSTRRRYTSRSGPPGMPGARRTEVEDEEVEAREPFTRSELVQRAAWPHCRGNNALCYLGLAYNSLTLASLRRLAGVLARQKMAARRPRGLLNVSLEGNPLPAACAELTRIDHMLEMGLMAMNPRLSVVMMKRRPTIHKLYPSK